MKPRPLTADHRDLIEADALAKLDLSPLVDAAHAAALAVRAAYLACLAETVPEVDLDVLRQHGCLEFCDSITVRVPNGRPGREDETRGVHVHLPRMLDNGEPLTWWREPDPELGVWMLTLWRRAPGYGVTSDSGGEKMPEAMRAVLAPLALAYEEEVNAVFNARERHRQTVSDALRACKTVAHAERVWPGSAEIVRIADATRQRKEEGECAYRERLRERCREVPVGRMVP